MPNILVVEDSRTQAEALRLALESGGLVAEVVSSGEAALARLAESPFDLVLSDVLLPGLSGYEVCRRIKADPKTQRVPVLLLTVLTDPLDVLQGLECGADNFLTKPCDPDFLLRRVHAVLGGGRDRPAGAPAPSIGLAFRGRGVTITRDKEQILDLLLSTLEEFVRTRQREHEERVAREALERSERFVRAALDALPMCVAVLDGVGAVLAVNGTWQRLGPGNPLCQANCAAGTDYLALCESAGGLEGGQELAAGIRAVAAGRRGDYAGEYSWAGSAGMHWFAVRVNRFGDGGGARLVIAHEDVTSRRQLEESLRRRAEELAEADRRKTEFLSVLAHELRNPLAPLQNALNLLDQPGLGPEGQQQARQVMARQLRHLGRLVDDLLDVARVSQGRVKLRPERLDLARLARQTVEDRRPLVEGAGLTLTVDAPETPVWVSGDPTRLAQVLANLLDNAVKFTEAGGRVAVGVGRDADGNQAVLIVTDTGAGIEAELLPRLFGAFAQADRTLDRSRGGLGLGLAVVKGLAELHGGSVTADSAGPGKGATFTIRLPLGREPQVLSAAPAADTRPAATGRRVLVVEDNRDAADSLEMLLRLLGYEARVARTGPEGVQAAKEWTPDVVLCDIGLPGLDGYGVARELRLHPTTARTRLLALTGYNSDEDRRRSREAGFDLHLTKPVAPDKLRDVLAAQGA